MDWYVGRPNYPINLKCLAVWTAEMASNSGLIKGLSFSLTIYGCSGKIGMSIYSFNGGINCGKFK